MVATQGQNYVAGLTGLALRAGMNITHTPTLTTTLDQHTHWFEHTINSPSDPTNAEGILLRTWSQRGTLHFLEKDYAWVVGVCGQRGVGKESSNAKRWGQSVEEYRETRDLVLSSIDNKRTSRAQIKEATGVSSSVASHHLRVLGAQGLIIQSHKDGTHDTFLRTPSDLIPSDLHDSHIYQLVVAYFSTRGPARLEDFTYWSGLTKTSTRASLDQAVRRGELIESIDGRSEKLWMAPWQKDVSSSDISTALSLSIQLPPFDEFLMSYTHRDDIYAKHCAREEVLTKNGISWPFLVENGLIQGRAG